MANSVLDFFNDMQKLMSSGLTQLGNALKQGGTSVVNYISNVVKRFDTLTTSAKNLETQISNTEDTIKNSTSRWQIFKEKLKLNELKDKIENHPGNGGKKEKEKSDGGLFKSVTDLFSKSNLLSLGKDILGKGMAQEKNIATLAPHLGKEGAAAAYANIKKDAVATPFDTDSLFEANKALINAGDSAKSARADTLALANAVSFAGGGNEQLTKMAELMGDVKKAGEASSEDLKKFADGGIDVYKALADATGTSVEKAKTMNVTYEQLSGALQKAGSAGGAFAGAMDQQNQTVAAKVGNFTDALEGGLANIGVAFSPVLGRLLDFGLTLINTLLPQIMQFVQPIMDMLNGLPIESILNSVMSVVTAIIGAVGPVLEALQPIFAALFETLGPLIEQISGFIVSLVQQLAPILTVIAHVVSAILAPAIKIVGAVLGWVIEGISKAVDFIMPIIKGIVDFISKIVDKVLWLLGIGDDNKQHTEAAKVAAQAVPKDTSLTPTQANATLGGGLSTGGAASSATPKTSETQAGKTATQITSGGPRVINISGIKFTDKIELHILNAKEGINELESALQEMFLRILNSGAVLQ